LSNIECGPPLTVAVDGSLGGSLGTEPSGGNVFVETQQGLGLRYVVSTPRYHLVRKPEICLTPLHACTFSERT
jgi:hypothetical protein